MAKTSNHEARRAVFIHELAKFLAGPDTARRSIELQLGKPDAVAWANMRSATPLCGYPTLEEAERVLADFLS